jgi:hypothetical protein
MSDLRFHVLTCSEHERLASEPPELRTRRHEQNEWDGGSVRHSRGWWIMNWSTAAGVEKGFFGEREKELAFSEYVVVY